MALVRTASGVQTIRLKKQQQKGTQRWYFWPELKKKQRTWIDGAHSSTALVSQLVRVT